MYGKQLGEMAWMDLSVADAKTISQFYQAVLGWASEPVEMTQGGESYQDFVMTSVNPSTENTAMDQSSKDESNQVSSDVSPTKLVTGICHARGDNHDMPATWLPYFLVKDIDESVRQVTENGGSLVTKMKSIDSDKYIVIKDPAGAMAAIYQKG